MGNGGPGRTGPGGKLLQGIVLYHFETRSRDAVSRKIRESTPVRGEEAAEEEANHIGAMGKFRSLWRLTRVDREYSDLLIRLSCVYVYGLSVAEHVIPS